MAQVTSRNLNSLGANDSRTRDTGFAAPSEEPLLAPALSNHTLSSSPPLDGDPQTIVAHCRAVLLARTPTDKVALVRRLVSLFRSGNLNRLADSKTDPPHPEEPYRAPSTKTVSSGQTRPLGKGGSVQTRIRMLHALANIELWAIDLAVDHVARFYDWRLGALDGQGSGKRIGWTFVADFLKVAEDEAKHFTLLSERLEALGCKYGDLSVHNGPSYLCLGIFPHSCHRHSLTPACRTMGVGPPDLAFALLAPGHHRPRARGARPRLEPDADPEVSRGGR